MKAQRYFLLLTLAILAAVQAMAHPYHTSIAEVNYNPKTESLEIAIKVFTDDLEETLSNQAKKPVAIKQSEEVQKQLEAYLKKALRVELKPNEALPQRLIGFEPQADAQWLYLEIPLKPEQLKQVKIRNQVLLDTFSDQMNIMNSTINGQKRTLLFKEGDVVKPLL